VGGAGKVGDSVGACVTLHGVGAEVGDSVSGQVHVHCFMSLGSWGKHFPVEPKISCSIYIKLFCFMSPFEYVNDFLTATLKKFWQGFVEFGKWQFFGPTSHCA